MSRFGGSSRFSSGRSSYSYGSTRLSTPKVYDPYKAAQTTVAHNIARLQAAGINPPTSVHHGNLLTGILGILDILNRPGAAVRGAIKAMITPQHESILGAAWRGLTGKENVTGSDLLRAAGLQIPKNKPLSGFLNWVLSTGTEIFTDPLTIIGIGAASKIGRVSTETLARNISREVLASTGRTISENSAKLLASNTLRNISLNEAALRAKFPKMSLNAIHDMAIEASTPIGELGNAVKRALGYEITNVAKVSPLQRIEKTATQVLANKLLGKNYKSVATTISRLESAINKGKVPTTVAQKYLDALRAEPKVVNATKIVRTASEVPKYYLELQFLGKPIAKIADITPGVNAIRNTAVRTGKLASKVVDLLGNMFNKDYTSITRQGAERIAVNKAKEVINETARKATPAETIAYRNVLQQWLDVPLDVQRKASYVIEEGMTKEAKNVAKAQKKLAEAKAILQERLKANASKRAISGAQRSVRHWTAKLETAQEALLSKHEANIGTRTITSELQNAANLARKMYAKDIRDLAKHGVNVNTIKDYVYHVFQNTPEEIDRVVSRLQRTSIPGAKPGFEYERLLNIPISQLKELGLKPIEEVGLTTAIHRAMTTHQIILQDMVKKLGEIGQDVIRRKEFAPADWIPVEKLDKNIGKKLPYFKNMALHPEVAKALNRLAPIINMDDEAIKTVSKIYNIITGHVKGLMTSYNPSFHLRNVLGNIFLNWADGVTNPKYYIMAIKILTNPKSVKAILNGNTIDGSIIAKLFTQEALIGQGAFSRLRGNQSITKSVIEEAQKIGMLPGQKNIWTTIKNAPRQLGETVDTVARLANFLYHLDKGESPVEAAQAVRRVLYDYGALSPFEQKLRNFIPFYSWIRFNTPAMIKLIATKPGIVTALNHAITSGMDINNISDDEVPQFIKDSLALPLGRTSNGNILYLNWSLPPADLARIHNLDDPTAIGQEILSMLNPVFTVPAQILSNTNWFTGQPISKNPKVASQFYKDSLRFALQQIQPVREIGSAYKYATEQPNKPVMSKHIPGLGTIITQINPQAVQRSNLYELRDLLQQIINMQKARGVAIPDWRDISNQWTTNNY